MDQLTALTQWSRLTGVTDHPGTASEFQIRQAPIIAGMLREWPESTELKRIRVRLEADTGADIQDIVDQLNGTETCAACNIEGQASYCIVWRTHRLGRRLRRLLERARGERAPGDVNATD